ncbi:hypothetical protein [Streptomyces syringium]|uniref:PH domain-containing protein n=1 Tax=Streptomyces syringium TaxID=76729 RepID=A0ABS4Y1Y6_9ACTN|nr:hypothetical protein [Streptomyces syringium]MBP2402776.1 hypothetical protein [Streptomyces syringium]
MGRRQALRSRVHGSLAHGRGAVYGREARPSAGGVLAWDRGWRREARSAWLCGLALAGVLTAIDLGRGGLDGPRGCFWAALGATLVLVLRPARITAGDGWLASSGLLRERRVRTDLLTRVRREDGMTPRLVLRDIKGGRVELAPQVLADNPLLWHHLDTGARRARERGVLVEGAGVLTALAERIDGEGARRLLSSAEFSPSGD